MVQERKATQALHKYERMRENNKLQDKDKKEIIRMFQNGSRLNHIAKKLGLTKELVDTCIRSYILHEEVKYQNETTTNNVKGIN